LLCDISLLPANGCLLCMTLYIRRLLEVSSVSNLLNYSRLFTLLDELADHLFVISTAFSGGYDSIRLLVSAHLYSYLSACQILPAFPIIELISTPASVGSSPRTLGLFVAPGAADSLMGSVPSKRSTPL
jgi:hypothetical protein